jgi:hypothetical protein
MQRELPVALRETRENASGNLKQRGQQSWIA